MPRLFNFLWCRYSEAKKDPKLLMAKDNVGMTPLHVAAVRGDADCCAVMLAAAEDPNALLQERDGEGRMCIHLASSHAHAECLERLLESDKNGHANATMNNGRTPLQLAALSGAPECVAVLLDHGVAGHGSTHTPPQLNPSPPVIEDDSVWVFSLTAAGVSSLSEVLLPNASAAAPAASFKSASNESDRSPL